MGLRRTALASLLALAAGLVRPAAAGPADIFDGYAPRMGGVHFHSAFSDGAAGSRPIDVYRAGAQSGMEFMFVTEHSEWLSLPVEADEDCLTDPAGRPITSCYIPPEEGGLTKWETQAAHAAQAESESPGFLALGGFEWSSPTQGHVGVLLSANHENAYLDGGPATMEGLYEWLRRDVALGGGADALATFNHPGREPGKFESFRYDPEVDTQMVGLEVFNRGNDYFPTLVEALDRGWHVGAIGAVDEHGPNWGRLDRARTVLLIPDGGLWNEAGVRETLSSRRFYATQDHGLSLEFTADGAPMGSRVGRPFGAPVTLAVEAPGATIQILTNGNTVVASGAGALSHQVSSGWGESWYLVRATAASGRKAYSSPIWIGASAHPTGQWVAGDLHVHTQFGHDTCSTPTERYDGTECDEPWTWSFTVAERIALAKERGLDYLAITDHNNVLSQRTQAWIDERDVIRELTLLPGYENSLRGHGQMLGAEWCYEPQRTADVEDCNMADEGAANVNVMAGALRADGGALQANHPAGEMEAREPPVESSAGWDWRYTYDVPVESVEVWNINFAWQPPAPSGNSSDDALRYWEGWLDRGLAVAATGGSDSHWRSTSAVQGVGQPTTWVWAPGGTWQDVVAGIRAGRTFISHQPPAYAGPRAFLEADADGNGTFESMPGDTIPSSAGVRLRVEGAPPGAIVRFITSDRVRHETPLLPTGIAPFDIATGATWVRAELTVPDGEDVRTAGCDPVVGSGTSYCRNRMVMLALTSAMLVQ